jgi:hypothetical protein
MPRTPRSHKPLSSVDGKRWTVALIGHSNRWRLSLVCSFQGVHIRRAQRLFYFQREFGRLRDVVHREAVIVTSHGRDDVVLQSSHSQTDLVRGDADLLMVMADAMALTKLNFYACIYGDGLPVTLRFASAVGEILTPGPMPENQPPLPFKIYI